MRRDLGDAQIAVQAAHACLELGKLHPHDGEHPHLVLVTVPDERQLAQWADRLRSQFPTVEFREPDLDNSLTAVACANVAGPARKVFRSLSLYKVAPMTTIQGKWGFYPCTREVFKKLKRLNFLAYQSIRRIAAWKRWNRKFAKNRIRYRYEAVDRETFGGLREVWMKIPDGPMPEPVLAPLTAIQRDVIHQDWLNARFPKTKPEDVKPLFLKETEIDSLLVEMEAWYAIRHQSAAKPKPKPEMAGITLEEFEETLEISRQNFRNAPSISWDEIG